MISFQSILPANFSTFYFYFLVDVVQKIKKGRFFLFFFSSNKSNYASNEKLCLKIICNFSEKTGLNFIVQSAGGQIA